MELLYAHPKPVVVDWPIEVVVVWTFRRDMFGWTRGMVADVLLHAAA